MDIDIDNLHTQVNELLEDVKLDPGKTEICIADFNNAFGDRIQMHLSITADPDELWDKTYPERICITPPE